MNFYFIRLLFFNYKLDEQRQAKLFFCLKFTYLYVYKYIKYIKHIKDAQHHWSLKIYKLKS